MSTSIVSIFTGVATFFEGLVEGNPAAQQAASDVKQAAASAESALEPLLDSIANEALGKIPFGSLAGPVADVLINGVISRLANRLSTPAAPQATMMPVANPT